MTDDPETLLENLRKIPPEAIEAATPGIIGNYPNTYTYTKNIGERMLLKYREAVPLCIVRPTIVVNSWKYPFPGWIDSVAAAGAFFLTAGLGLM
jgi:nucleoside-diphosphate-sugar epimerase